MSLGQTPAGEDEESRDSVEALLILRSISERALGFYWKRLRRPDRVRDDSERVEEDGCQCLSCHMAQQVGVS